MWKSYFNFIKLVPGKVVTHGFGTIDFSRDDIPVQTIKTLFENGFPYLQITEHGKAELYNTTDETAGPVQPVKTARLKSRNPSL